MSALTAEISSVRADIRVLCSPALELRGIYNVNTTNLLEIFPTLPTVHIILYLVCTVGLQLASIHPDRLTELAITKSLILLSLKTTIASSLIFSGVKGLIGRQSRLDCVAFLFDEVTVLLNPETVGIHPGREDTRVCSERLNKLACVFLQELEKEVVDWVCVGCGVLLISDD